MRTHNLTARELCLYCLDDGYVVAHEATEEEQKTGGYGDVMAPCPFCEAGFREEFGYAAATNKQGAIKPPWDPENGYWLGRDTSFLKPHPRPIELTPAEAADHARAAMKVVFPSP